MIEAILVSKSVNFQFAWWFMSKKPYFEHSEKDKYLLLDGWEIKLLEFATPCQLLV